MNLTRVRRKWPEFVTAAAVICVCVYALGHFPTTSVCPDTPLAAVKVRLEAEVVAQAAAANELRSELKKIRAAVPVAEERVVHAELDLNEKILTQAADLRAGTGGESARRSTQAQLSKMYTRKGISLPIGYVRIPTLPEPVQEGAPLAAEAKADDARLHVIFSSGCNWAQHWESEAAMVTAAIVGQRGRITRIVSGCHDTSAVEDHDHRYHNSAPGKNDDIVPISFLNRSVNSNFGLFITPPFEGAKEFPWINKPTGIAYFMEHAQLELDRMGETIIAVIDPDFLFLKPLTMVGRPQRELLLGFNYKWPIDPASPVDVPEVGRPVSQRYGIEGAWTSKFKVDKIASAGSKALNWDGEGARKYFSVGPPMIHHIQDFKVLAPLWSKFMPKVLEQDKDIIADMWAYAIASAELNLNHTTLIGHMTTEGREDIAGYGRQIRQWGGKVDFRCSDPIGSRSKHSNPEELLLPTFLHYAQHYDIGSEGDGSDYWQFFKGYVPFNILSCSTPYIIVAPDSVWEDSPDRCSSTGKQICKATTWHMCQVVHRINQVAKLYKTKFCPAFEQRHLIRLKFPKDRDQNCRQNVNIWCWPISQIEGLPDNWRSQKLGPILVPNPLFAAQK